ncbi:hypothetical protein KI387_031263, partial [Taxus chinensis]
ANRLQVQECLVLYHLMGPQMVTVLDQQEKPNFPEKILTRNRIHGVNSVTTINPSSAGGRKKDFLTNGHGASRTYPNGQFSSAMPSESFQLDNRANSKGVPSIVTEFELTPKVLPSSQQQTKYNSLEEVEGRIYLIAKDQHGCRFLQKKFEEGIPQDVHAIFVEIINHIIELMTDPFGNYLVQKLLEVCNEDQRLQILLAVTGKPGELVNISLNMHGTRAVQRLIETLKTPEQISLVVKSLKSGVVTLIKDLNGNHVVQRCLQCLNDKDNQCCESRNVVRQVFCNDALYFSLDDGSDALYKRETLSILVSNTINRFAFQTFTFSTIAFQVAGYRKCLQDSSSLLQFLLSCLNHVSPLVYKITNEWGIIIVFNNHDLQ